MHDAGAKSESKRKYLVEFYINWVWVILQVKTPKTFHPSRLISIQSFEMKIHENNGRGLFLALKLQFYYCF